LELNRIILKFSNPGAICLGATNPHLNLNMYIASIKINRRGKEEESVEKPVMPGRE
jgi:hypothetical protein